jgi:hypothetical protein
MLSAGLWQVTWLQESVMSMDFPVYFIFWCVFHLLIRSVHNVLPTLHHHKKQTNYQTNVEQSQFELLIPPPTVKNQKRTVRSDNPRSSIQSIVIKNTVFLCVCLSHIYEDYFPNLSFLFFCFFLHFLVFKFIVVVMHMLTNQLSTSLQTKQIKM